MPASGPVPESFPVPMRELLASCAAARAVSTPPWHPQPPADHGAGPDRHEARAERTR